MGYRHELTDEQWQRRRPLLPPEKAQTGKPNLPHRTIVNGIVWRLKTGAPWRDVPERYGKWATVYSRFRRWQRAGIWDRLLAALQSAGDAAGQLDWEVHFADGTVIRAHQHAAGAQKKGATKRSAAARVASARRSTSALKAAAGRSSRS